jgi:hypothetical protein
MGFGPLSFPVFRLPCKESPIRGSEDTTNPQIPQPENLQVAHLYTLADKALIMKPGIFVF